MWEDFWKEFRRIEDRMNRLFQELSTSGPRMLTGGPEGDLVPFYGGRGLRSPYTDVMEREDEVVVAAELPGVNKKDIKINVDRDRLEISAETKHETKKEGEGFTRQERSYGGFYRSLRLPETVDPSKAKATYKNGVLEVRLPKTESSKKKEIKVE